MTPDLDTTKQDFWDLAYKSNDLKYLKNRTPTSRDINIKINENSTNLLGLLKRNGMNECYFDSDFLYFFLKV